MDIASGDSYAIAGTDVLVAATLGSGVTASSLTSLGTLTGLATGAISAYINETANTKMTVGLTINQGANDNEIWALKSSDVDHEMTDIAETDTYVAFQKMSAAAGGVRIAALSTTGNLAFQLFAIAGGAGDTTHTTGGEGIVRVNAGIKNGANVQVPGAGVNLFAIRDTSGGTQFICTVEGDIYANGAGGTAIGAGLLDNYDDAGLVRAFDAARAPDEMIRTAHDDWVRYNETDLVEAGILGAPLDEGGLWCTTQHLRLLNGAVWQAAEDIMSIVAVLSPDQRKALTPRIQRRLASAGA
jgi:hypothetical protein